MDARFAAAKILIVDDEDVTTTLLERKLGQSGFANLKAVTDPTLVSGLLDTFKPDIILLDLQMPVLDGFGVMRVVKEHMGKDDFLPILVLTADAQLDTRRKALSHGATDFLTLPFELFEVLLRTQNLLRTRFLHCDLQDQNAVLEANVRERTTALASAHHEVLERLARACELRDDDTGEHTKRVGTMAGRIASVLGFSLEDAEMIRFAAQLHDIGKTGIPDSILLKPGKLTPEEFGEMKRHAELGASLLSNSNVPLIMLAEAIALTHHEKWDGSGYPKGLSGDNIPLSGRILAVADVFDALTHDRPYKPAWEIPDAIREIRRLTGQHFDPTVVDATLTVLSNSGLYRPPVASIAA